MTLSDNLSPKVSIIIPVYNVSEYIEECITSVLGQTHKNIELIIINDNTPDDSMAKIKTLLKEQDFSRIKIIEHTTNKGLSVARNSGITESTGDYIYFIDSDDWISENCIQLLVDAAILHKADFSIGNFHATDQNIFNSENPLCFDNDCYIENPLETFLNLQWYSMACNKLIKRNLFVDNDLTFEPDIYHEDELWSLKLATYANSFSISYENTYFYRIRHDSITQKGVTHHHIQSQAVVFNRLASFFIIRPEVQTENFYHNVQRFANSPLELNAGKKLIDEKKLFSSIKKDMYRIIDHSNLSFNNKLKGKLEWHNPMFHDLAKKLLP